jgi:anaerobic magnesium-protoporphyrin IX monomethyl ester cyclase
MKTSLIFPPGWDITQPYLGLPALKAYIENARHQASLHDLNLELYDYLTSRKGLAHAYNYVTIDSDDDIELLLYNIRPSLLQEIETAKQVLRSDDFFDEEKRSTSFRVLDLALQAQQYAFPNMQLSLGRLRVKVDTLTDDILQQHLASEDDALQLWYRQYFIPTLELDRPDLIGISIVNYDQLLPALILAKEIKRRYNSVHLTLGGDIATRLAAPIISHPYVGKIIDSVVCGEGEKSLLALLDWLQNGGDNRLLFDVPNLCFKAEDGTVTRTQLAEPVPCHELPTPDFTGLPLTKYFAPRLVLPVEAGRGCYWNKCGFCEEVGKPYRHHSTDTVVKHISDLASRYGTKYFSFTDSSMSPKFIKEFSAELLAHEIEIYWRALMRAEAAFDQITAAMAAKAGCRMLLIGVESTVPRIRDLICKGGSVAQTTMILNNLEDHEIWSHCYFMAGLPTETVDEAMETVKYISENSAIIDSVGLSDFVACKGAPITERLSELKVEIDECAVNPWTLHFEHLQGNIMCIEKKEIIHKAFNEALSELKTKVDVWLQLHVNHLFLQIAFKGRNSLTRIIP